MGNPTVANEAIPKARMPASAVAAKVNMAFPEGARLRFRNGVSTNFQERTAHAALPPTRASRVPGERGSRDRYRAKARNGQCHR